jgi:hypothetical protein
MVGNCGSDDFVGSLVVFYCSARILNPHGMAAATNCKENIKRGVSRGFVLRNRYTGTKILPYVALPLISLIAWNR